MLRSWVLSTYFCQAIEAILFCFILVLAFAAPSLGAEWFRKIEEAIARLARRPWRAFLLVVSGVLLTRLLLLLVLPMPSPSIHDEFSYLLAGQTFAAGRLTNLTPPFWKHFESVHILQQPTYMSMYPPGQGLALALGIRLTGYAWAGVVLGVCLLCGTLFWALKGWFPAPWALTITLLTAVRWCLVSYWMNSYWGGALPALGGALVFGSVPRLVHQSRSRDSLLLALGLVLLANTRPYEGLVVSVVCLGILLVWSRRIGTVHKLCTPAVMVPVAAVLGLSVAATLSYNAHVTGSAFTLPYIEDRREYAIAPIFLWGPIRPEPQYSSPSLRAVYLAEARMYQQARQCSGVPEVFRKLKNIWIFFIGPLLTIPIAIFLFSRKDARGVNGSRLRYIRIILLGMLLASLQVVWLYPHYLAPAFAPFLAALLIGFRDLRRWHWRRRPAGLFLGRALPLGCVLMASIPASAHFLGWRLSYWPLQWALGAPAEVHTKEVESLVLADGKKALVLVEYGKNHDPGYEWVYNAPDIENARIAWARETDPGSDAALIQHFRGRSIWLLKPDEHPFVLKRLQPKSIGTGQVLETIR